MASTLTFLQKRFVAELPRCNGNGAEAARRAGYSPTCAKQVAHTLLRKDKVQMALHQQIHGFYPSHEMMASAISALLQSSKSSDVHKGLRALMRIRRAVFHGNPNY